MAKTQVISNSTSSRKGYTNAGKSAYIFDPEYGHLCHGTTLDADQVERLAKWLCEWCCSYHATRDVERKGNGGFCISCGDNAAWMLLQCPYLDMSRPDQNKFVS